jgi:hypothetical protein
MAYHSQEGFVRVRRGILGHLKDGLKDDLDFKVYYILLAQADFKTGVWRGTVHDIAHVLPEPTNITTLLSKLRKSLERLKANGYVAERRKQGSREAYSLYIEKFDTAAGGLLNAKQSAAAGKPVFYAEDGSLGGSLVDSLAPDTSEPVVSRKCAGSEDGVSDGNTGVADAYTSLEIVKPHNTISPPAAATSGGGSSETGLPEGSPVHSSSKSTSVSFSGEAHNLVYVLVGGTSLSVKPAEINTWLKQATEALKKAPHYEVLANAIRIAYANKTTRWRKITDPSTRWPMAMVATMTDDLIEDAIKLGWPSGAPYSPDPPAYEDQFESSRDCQAITVNTGKEDDE